MKDSEGIGNIGQPKGGAKYLVSDADDPRSTACIEAFAQRFGFKLAAARAATWPNSYSFVDIWFHCGAGFVSSVTNVTGPGKFHIAFYAQNHDAKSAAAARSAFSSFVDGMTDFDRVEVYPVEGLGEG
jgi:hypothetical protein